ncbi:hypothetical protein [Eubacterium aggregans]|nr:hypothetical protein [Eubacterium aggregans]
MYIVLGFQSENDKCHFIVIKLYHVPVFLDKISGFLAQGDKLTLGTV